jgi:homoserine dehydrogenase
MFDEGVGYEPVLAEAQDLGFAESDPTLDVDGFDAKYKLVITTGHAFGVFLNPEEVVNIGIRQISAADFQYAREKGYKIQLVATSRRLGDNLVSFVLPQFVPEHHLLHGVTKEFNGIVVGAAFAEEQFFLGKGAGGYPTASAVLSDISALSYGYRYSYKKRQQGQSLSPTRELPLRVYLRFATGSNAPDRLGLQNVEVSHEEADLSYAIGTVELATLVEQGSDLRHEPIIPILMPEQPSMGEDDTVKASLAAAQALHS